MSDESDHPVAPAPALVFQHDRPGRYVPIAEAVQRTGRSKDHFHRAIKRGAIDHERDATRVGRATVRVWLDDDDAGPVADEAPASSMRDRRANGARRADASTALALTAASLGEQMGRLADKLAAEAAARARAEAERDVLQRELDRVLRQAEERAVAALGRVDGAIARHARPWWRLW